MNSETNRVRLRNLLPGTVKIQQKGPDRWHVTQNHTGHHEHNQAATCIRITNPGKTRGITLELRWAEYGQMALRKAAYLEKEGEWQIVQGAIEPMSTTYQLEVPTGTSCFSPLPWYSLARAERFLAETAAGSSRCQIMDIGRTREDRAVRCLVIDAAPENGQKADFVITARQHATETAGSFAVEQIVRVLLALDPAHALLDAFRFHIFPAVNPDGVAHGWKYPQNAPAEVSDMHYFGATSNDPTCRTFRDWLYTLRPACMLDFHGYLLSMPQLIFYDWTDGLVMTEALLRRDSELDAPMLYTKYQTTGGERETTDLHCWRHFDTVCALFELPWAGFPEAAVRQTGMAAFLAVVEAYERRMHVDLHGDLRAVNAHCG